MTATQGVDPNHVIVADTPTGTTVFLALLPIAGAVDDPQGTCTALVAAVESWLSQSWPSSGLTHPLIGVPIAAEVSSSRLTGVMEWMRANLGESMSLDELAERAFLSRRQFTREFRAEMGTSPSRWLLEQRLDEATRLLERSRLAIERIAGSTGFPTPAAFRTHFKRRTGLSPSEYRRQQETRAAALGVPPRAA